MARHGYPELEPDQRGVPDNSEEQPGVPQRRSMPTSLNVSHKQGRPIGTLLVSSAVVVWLGVLLFTTEPFPSTAGPPRTIQSTPETVINSITVKIAGYNLCNGRHTNHNQPADDREFYCDQTAQSS